MTGNACISQPAHLKLYFKGFTGKKTQRFGSTSRRVGSVYVENGECSEERATRGGRNGLVVVDRSCTHGVYRLYMAARGRCARRAAEG